MKLMTSAPHHDYWDSFYASRASGGVPEEPSAFGRWVLDELAPGQPVVEFGFGTARDALWFADRGHQVLGYDFAESAVHQAQGRADGRSLPAGFEVLDLYDGPRVDAVAAELAGTVGTCSTWPPACSTAAASCTSSSAPARTPAARTCSATTTSACTSTPTWWSARSRPAGAG
jgi:hypothetical protein